MFPKYHKNGEATEDSFTEDGWYKTGDLGRIDDDGFLYIIGRKKDLIITAGGKNVSPGPIEDVIKRCEFVSQALVLGDKRPFISALITLDEEALLHGWKARVSTEICRWRRPPATRPSAPKSEVGRSGQ